MSRRETPKRKPPRKNKREQYARIPVVVRGIARVKVPPGLTVAEVERAASIAAKNGMIFDATRFTDGVRLAVEASVLAHLTARDDVAADADAALASLG